jgi:SAM-dependent methyltransferase
MPVDSQAHAEDIGAMNAPIPQSQPESLFAIGHIRGMRPRDVAQARVLEIGCGDGSNLVPLAERYPQSTFVGVDASPRHVAAAAGLASDLGLENVEFRRQRILEFSADPGEFDYIVAAGVYSWVDAESRDKLLAICQTHLAPHGIAYVNYNAYPGWHFHELLGAMMRYEARGAETLAQRLAAARVLMEFLKASLPADDGGYGSLLGQQLEPLARQPEAFLVRNYLHDECHAVYFGQFVAHAGRHGLQMLGDCGLGIRFNDSLSTRDERGLDAITLDPVEKEQIRDILKMRAHRQGLLCHDALALQHWPGPQRLGGLYLEARLKPEDPQAKIESTAADTFVAPGGLSISTAVPSIKAALAHLGAIWPNYIAYQDLVAAACARIEATAGGSKPIAPAERRKLEDNLLTCCADGIIQIHGAAQPFAGAASERPAASPLARWQAKRGDVATNRKHLRVRLEHFDRHVLQLLDGTRSVSELVEELSAAIGRGQMSAVENGNPVPAHRLAQFLGNALDESLKRLADNALLVA